MATIQDLQAWIERDITRFGTSESCVEFVDLGDVHDINSDRRRSGFDLKFHFYTDIHQFTVVAREDTTNRCSYLGCTALCRKPRAGETWRRGNDLADGPLEEETWRRILGDVISYSTVKVHRPKPLIKDDSLPTDAPAAPG